MHRVLYQELKHLRRILQPPLLGPSLPYQPAERRPGRGKVDMAQVPFVCAVRAYQLHDGGHLPDLVRELCF